VPIPERISAGWIATLEDDQLIKFESELRDVFNKHEVAERKRKGSRYAVLEGPEILVNSYLKWQMVSNEARERGLAVRQRRA
jgi:transposase